MAGIDFSQPTVIVICGMPAHGKSTLAEALGLRLGLHVIDIDNSVRVPLFGAPKPNIDTLNGNNKLVLGLSYRLMFQAAEYYLTELQESVIVVATFIRRERQKFLEDFYAKFPWQTTILWCNLEEETAEEIERRLASRAAPGSTYAGGVTSRTEYDKVNAIKQSLPDNLPHQIIDTSKPPEDCLEAALAAIQHSPAYR